MVFEEPVSIIGLWVQDSHDMVQEIIGHTFLFVMLYKFPEVSKG